MTDDDFALGGAVLGAKAKKRLQEEEDNFVKKLENKTPRKARPNGLSAGRIEYDRQKVEFSDPNSKEQGYTPYQILLARGYEIMAKQNPNIKSRKKCRILPPMVSLSGRKKTVYANMKETVELLKRDFEHLKDFLYAELGTTGSVDGSKRLILKGRFRVGQVQSVLGKYAENYVICENCTSPLTKLTRDAATRLYSMKCDTCNSERRVQAIRSGFRAKMRGERRTQRQAIVQQ